MADVKLTVAERSLIHIAIHAKHPEDLVAPRAIAISGVGEALGVSRAHAAMALKEAGGRGLLERRQKHVNGEPRQIWVYFPTQAGLEFIEKLSKESDRPLEELIFVPAAETAKRRELKDDIQELRIRLNDLEARARAEGWL